MDTLKSILESANDTENLLKTAFSELVAFQKKYFMLKELAGVFEAISDAEKGAGLK